MIASWRQSRRRSTCDSWGREDATEAEVDSPATGVLPTRGVSNALLVCPVLLVVITGSRNPPLDGSDGAMGLIASVEELGLWVVRCPLLKIASPGV